MVVIYLVLISAIYINLFPSTFVINIKLLIIFRLMKIAHMYFIMYIYLFSA